MVDPAHADDWALAQACAAGDGPASARFESEFLSAVPRFVGRLSLGPAAIGDLQSALRDHLLPPPIGCEGKIACYLGRGPLAGWLRIIALRMAFRKSKAQPRPSPPVPLTPELDVLKARYGPAFRSLFAEAAAGLDARQRAFLRLRYESGASVASIARVYRLDRTTVWRQIQVAKVHLAEALRAGARETFQDSNFTSLLGLFSSQIESGAAVIFEDSVHPSTAVKI